MTECEPVQVEMPERRLEVLISVVILTYNRGALIRELVEALLKINHQPLEIIVVDNCSHDPARNYLHEFLSSIRLIEMPSNVGVAGRNKGIEECRGEIVITLDDDVHGLDDNDVCKIVEILEDAKVGAVCFKVVDSSNRISNWCHHYDAEEYSDREFITNEITEGAVAFKRAALHKAGLYPGEFFISHEGPDLAFRIMNQGYLVVYSPDVRLIHHHSPNGRASWRRYYYDTRNLLWLAVRNYRLLYGVKRVAIGIGAMFVYAMRDGYLRYFWRGIRDGLKGLPRAYRERTAPTESTWTLIEQIERHRPGFWKMVRKRLLGTGVRI